MYIDTPPPPSRNGSPFRSWSAHVGAPPLKAWCCAGTWGGTDQEGSHCDHIASSVPGVELGVQPGKGSALRKTSGGGVV